MKRCRRAVVVWVGNHGGSVCLECGACGGNRTEEEECYTELALTDDPKGSGTRGARLTETGSQRWWDFQPFSMSGPCCCVRRSQSRIAKLR